jgi:uncharacterized protein YjiS (DUF1127 family)
MRSQAAQVVEFAALAGHMTGVTRVLETAACCADLWNRKRAVATLQALDDRSLKDIGIARSEIWHLVNHPGQE